jgi:hypothetical protein
MPDSTTKQPKPSHIKDLALLFSIPIAIAVLAAVAVYVPSLFAHPTYDFVYSLCEDYRCMNNYTVDSSGTVSVDTLLDYNDRDFLEPGAHYRSASLRYYDAAEKSYRGLTLQEAKRYNLDTSSVSPDGYTLVKENSSNGFLFWDSYDEGWYLKNGAKKQNVVLTNGDTNYYDGTEFLGWVKQ